MSHGELAISIIYRAIQITGQETDKQWADFMPNLRYCQQNKLRAFQSKHRAPFTLLVENFSVKRLEFE
jgi:hypothetical protein